MFLKYWHTDILNARMDALIRNIVQIQSRVRMYLARRNFLYDLHIQRQQLEQLGMLCSLVEQSSEMLYNEMVQHMKYDREKATKKVINSCHLEQLGRKQL